MSGWVSLSLTSSGLPARYTYYSSGIVIGSLTDCDAVREGTVAQLWATVMLRFLGCRLHMVVTYFALYPQTVTVFSGSQVMKDFLHATKSNPTNNNRYNPYKLYTNIVQPI